MIWMLVQDTFYENNLGTSVNGECLRLYGPTLKIALIPGCENSLSRNQLNPTISDNSTGCAVLLSSIEQSVFMFEPLHLFSCQYYIWECGRFWLLNCEPRWRCFVLTTCRVQEFTETHSVCLKVLIQCCFPFWFPGITQCNCHICSIVLNGVVLLSVGFNYPRQRLYSTLHTPSYEGPWTNLMFL